MTRTYRIADLFCGAGGSSTGAIRAIEALGGQVDLVAVNHWDVAIATHSRNHPKARHFCVNLDSARPEELVPEGQLDLLMASPECTYFSRARGGKPISDQQRMSAWHVQRWASTLDIGCILVENVPEFVMWGPVDTATGKPIQEKKGSYFVAWREALVGMGYDVDYRLINSADYGGATTRTRFFLQARKDGRAIRWPEPSHSQDGSRDMFGGRPRWRAAREIIDWRNPGGSLLNRKRPLSLKTRLRIARGLRRFGGPLAPLYIQLLDLPAEYAPSFQVEKQERPNGAKSFTFGNREHTVARSTEEPVATMTTSTGGGIGVVTPTADPFILGQQSGSVARPVDQPIPTIATGGHIRLIRPMLTSYYGANDGAQSVEDPVPTITTKARHGLCSPLIVPYGPSTEARPVEEPLPTVLTKDRLGVAVPTVEPFVMGKQSNPSYRSLEEPLPTVLTQGAAGGWLVNPFIVPQFGEAEGQAPRVHEIDDPLPSVTSHGAGAVVQPMVLQMAQVGRQDEGMARSVEDPLYTITTHNNLAVAEPVLSRCGEGAEVDPRRLVLVDGVPHLLDIRFRMLNNRELARAMGFDEGTRYDFVGTQTDITRQIGNAVEVHTAQALVMAILEDRPAEKRQEVPA